VNLPVPRSVSASVPPAREDQAASYPEHDRERLALALEAAGLDLWENNLATGEITIKASRIFAELGYTDDEISPSFDNLLSLVHPEDIPRIRQAIAAHVAGETPRYRCEFRGRSKSGRWTWFDNYGRIVGDSPAERRFIGVTFNIDGRKRQEEALEASRELLHRTERQRLVDEERHRLMQDMHDGLGSTLVSALRAVERGALDAPRTAQVLRDCLDDLKLTIDSMEAQGADLVFLLATLRFRMEQRLEGAGIRLRWEVREVPELAWLMPRHSLHILRILQEAFSNIIKHAGAGEVVVSTQAGAQVVSVHIADDGRGFDPGAERSQGKRGMNNQRRRAAAIGASVEWTSGPGGTRFSLHLPR
jgi:PAS domain S-box-containing protein